MLILHRLQSFAGQLDLLSIATLTKHLVLEYLGLAQLFYPILWSIIENLPDTRFNNV